MVEKLICENCKHWDPIEPIGPGVLQGECVLAQGQSDEDWGDPMPPSKARAEYFGEEDIGDAPRLITDADFSCIQWTAK